MKTILEKVSIHDVPKNVYGELMVYDKNGAYIWNDFNSDNPEDLDDLKKQYTHWLKDVSKEHQEIKLKTQLLIGRLSERVGHKATLEICREVSAEDVLPR